MSDNILKIWGDRNRILLDDKNEIDLLRLKANHFCSTHKHEFKHNKFYVVEGKVRIDTIFNKKILKKGESCEVPPNILHRFFAITNATMIEIAFIKEGKIDPEDINRKSLGGKIVDGVEYTIDDLNKKGLLEL